MEKRKLEFEFTQYRSEAELTEIQQYLVKKAKESANKAYAPYSKFKVGCALLLDNNEVVLGNNQENAAYPDGLCAERVAMFAAKANYPKAAIKTIVITAVLNDKFVDVPVSPCGSCRQVMVEYEKVQEKPFEIILHGANELYVAHSATSLLPLHFDSDFL